jgi:hypothetical protein
MLVCSATFKARAQSIALVIAIAIAISPFGRFTSAEAQPSKDCVAEFERVNALNIATGPYKVITMRIRGDYATVMHTLTVAPPHSSIRSWSTPPEAYIVVGDKSWTRQNDGPWLLSKMTERMNEKVAESWLVSPRHRLLLDMEWAGLAVNPALVESQIAEQIVPSAWTLRIKLRCEPDAVLDGVGYRVFTYSTRPFSHCSAHYTVYADRSGLRPEWQASYLGPGRGCGSPSETLWQAYIFDAAITIHAPE